MRPGVQFIDQECEMKQVFTIMQDFLRDPDDFFRAVQRNEDVGSKAWMLGLVSLLSFMIYGATVGLAKMPLQALSSAVKLPVLFLSTMIFCLPALYFFSLALLGTPLRMTQVLTVVLAGVSVTAFLLLGLAPITLFFVLTSTGYEFFQLLAVAFVGVSAWIGVYFLWRGMTQVELTREEARKVLGRRILFLWILLYGFVGTQMTWRLSPFIGRPQDPFFILKPTTENFYLDVARAVQGALQIPADQAAWTTPLVLGSLCVLALGLIFFAGGMMIDGLIRKPTPRTEQGKPAVSR
jgi:hypothetical protein